MRLCREYIQPFGKHGKALGAGTFGKVKLMQDLDTGTWYALKSQNIAYDNDDHIRIANKELNNLNIRGESLGSMWLNKNGQYRFLVAMKLAPGKNLYDTFIANRTTQISDDIMLKATHNIATSFMQMHKQGLVHCDIKADNINIDLKTLTPSILDMGLALPPGTHASQLGAIPFRAPELQTSRKVTTASDVYALVLTFCEVFGMAEYVNKSTPQGMQVYPQLMAANNPQLANSRIANPQLRQAVWSLLQKGLNPDPAKRLTMQQLTDGLNNLTNRATNALGARHAAAAGGFGGPPGPPPPPPGGFGGPPGPPPPPPGGFGALPPGPPPGRAAAKVPVIAETTAVQIKNIIIQGQAGEFNLSANVSRSRTAPTAPMAIEPNHAVPDPVPRMVEYIRGIAAQANQSHAASLKQRSGNEGPLVTRVIMDEFSLYPKDKPLSIYQYKALIAQVMRIAKTLPPDIHMMLATVPVLWPDNTIHNSALYLQSPKAAGQQPLIHHFAKQYTSAADFRYANRYGQEYPISGDIYHSPHSPNTVLADSGVSVNDPDQYHGALKVTTSNGQSYMHSAEICLDHKYNVANINLEKLIAQLGRQQKQIPTDVSQLVASYTIKVDQPNVFSTVAHADPVEIMQQMPAVATGVTNKSFGQGAKINYYDPHPVGAAHGQMLQAILGSQNAKNISARINAVDSKGDTMLHRALAGYHRANFGNLVKRVQTMLNLGANILLKNKNGISPMDIFKKIQAAAKSKPNNHRELVALQGLEASMTAGKAVARPAAMPHAMMPPDEPCRRPGR